MSHHTEIMNKCYKTCTETINHCLDMGGEHAARDHINIMMDCAKVCQLSVDFAVRESDNTDQINELCADVCRQCADECERLADGDEKMLECAKVCRDCAEACEPSGV